MIKGDDFVEALKESVEKLKGLSTATISDALDMMGINGGCELIRPLAPGMSLVGPAYTVAFEPVGEGEKAPAGEFIDEVEAGSVVVIANGGRTYCTVWGDLLALTAKQRGVAGTVIDGCCRDATGIIEMGYPLFSVSAYMKSGKNRVKLVAKQAPVKIVECTVKPGDMVCADDSGVIVIPSERLGETVETALRIEEMERQIIEDLSGGVSLKEARARRNYNDWALQRTKG